MHDDLLQVRAPGLNFHVLRDPRGLYLIDGGFLGGNNLLRRALKKRGWSKERVLGILVTHGHLDHILNVGRMAEDAGAWIAAPRLDAAHYAGCPVYRGAARITGFLEALGRAFLGFRKFTPTRWLDDGDHLDIWHGLTVVHLPGHTAGHSGYYCARRKLLFCADLFASYGVLTHLPPAIFNSSGSEIPGSVAKALDLDLDGILPNHGDQASPRDHLDRLVALKRRIQRGKKVVP